MTATLGKLRTLLREMCRGDQPVVVHSAIWPIARALGLREPAAIEHILMLLVDAIGPNRTLLMPTFVDGYRDGICDLDTRPSSTGILTEFFRCMPGVRRTVSAFFPFAVLGPDRDLLVALRPREAWGDDSLYEWMEMRDALLLLLGCHPTHASFLHRLEWLQRDVIPYRFNKCFAGVVLHETVEIPLCEVLYVRVRKPNAVNDFTVLYPLLAASGMRIESFDGVPISVVSTRTMRDAVMPALTMDPLLVLKNRDDFIGRKGGKE